MPLLRNSAFYCDHLDISGKDALDIQKFSVKDERGNGLVDYIKNFALDDEIQGVMRTYLVRADENSELVGYFSLKAGLVSFNEGNENEIANFDTLPGVELANFAVNNEYLLKNPEAKGIGISIFNDFIVPIIEETAKNVGVRIIYIFALPFESLIIRYGKYGFMRLEPAQETELHRRLKPRYDRRCIFMYQML